MQELRSYFDNMRCFGGGSPSAASFLIDYLSMIAAVGVASQSTRLRSVMTSA
jgi:hypothetical protein